MLQPLDRMVAHHLLVARGELRVAQNHLEDYVLSLPTRLTTATSGQAQWIQIVQVQVALNQSDRGGASPVRRLLSSWGLLSMAEDVCCLLTVQRNPTYDVRCTPCTQLA